MKRIPRGLVGACLIPAVCVLPACLQPERLDATSTRDHFAPAADGGGGSDESVPAGDAVPVDHPDILNVENIIQLVFSRSASVTAAREDMLASQLGLEEFRRNLDRLEPFVETRADLSDFPNRSGAFGHQVEAVVGVQKETFEGAVLRTEVGGAMSRFLIDHQMLSSGEFVEDGSGVLMRARFEAPFFGSRRRQNRVIAQAFQKSTARKAQLDYLDDYRNFVDNALSYYISIVYHERLVAAYRSYIDDLDALLAENNLEDVDREVVESQKFAAEFQRDAYRTGGQETRTILFAELAIPQDAEVELEKRPYRLSDYAVDAKDSTQLGELIARARQNNPTFTVLADAIANTELQRQQAIDGSLDVTTYLEGTIFPLGSATFDDRLDGWSVGGGVVVRLNDRRVLTATRLKAEAEIRQFRAATEAEEILMRRRIAIETQGLVDLDEHRKKLDSTRRKQATVWSRQRAEYLAGRVNINQVLQARRDLRSTDVELAQNTYGSESRERRLKGALGVIYDVVGLDIHSATPPTD